MTQWQPIETAPKDGKPVQVWVYGWPVTAAAYHEEGAGWNEDQPGWYEPFSQVWLKPSHWKPLDEPPAAPRRLVWMPEAQQIKSPVMARHIKARDATRASKP